MIIFESRQHQSNGNHSMIDMSDVALSADRSECNHQPAIGTAQSTRNDVPQPSCCLARVVSTGRHSWDVLENLWQKLLIVGATVAKPAIPLEEIKLNNRIW